MMVPMACLANLEPLAKGGPLELEVQLGHQGLLEKLERLESEESLDLMDLLVPRVTLEIWAREGQQVPRELMVTLECLGQQV